jgi:AcrR family transcriptional regulator
LPKPFSEKERANIKERLIHEAMHCLKLYGVRKTTVDELVKRANIPKGTFYLFYESKELLFFDVFTAYHDALHADIFKQLEQFIEPIDSEQLTELIFGLYLKVEGSFLYHFMTSGDLELLMRKLPQEAVEAHALKDELSIETLLSLAPHLKPENTKSFSAALRAIFLSMLYKREIGEDVFGDALKIMIRGVVTQMF